MRKYRDYFYKIINWGYCIQINIFDKNKKKIDTFKEKINEDDAITFAEQKIDELMGE